MSRAVGREALDPALPGLDADAGTRRLAAGDWVHVSGSNPSLAGIGKIVDGEYAPRDSVLLQARVELARGTYWFSPTVLARIEPQDEALLCDEALAREVVAGVAAERLRADLESYRRGEVGFVRTPGLLDRLWTCLGERDGSGPPGLAKLFNEGASVLVAARRRALTPAAPGVDERPGTRGLPRKNGARASKIPRFRRARQARLRSTRARSCEPPGFRPANPRCSSLTRRRSRACSRS